MWFWHNKATCISELIQLITLFNIFHACNDKQQNSHDWKLPNNYSAGNKLRCWIRHLHAVNLSEFPSLACRCIICLFLGCWFCVQVSFSGNSWTTFLFLQYVINLCWEIHSLLCLVSNKKQSWNTDCFPLLYQLCQLAQCEYGPCSTRLFAVRPNFYTSAQSGSYSNFSA